MIGLLTNLLARTIVRRFEGREPRRDDRAAERGHYQPADAAAFLAGRTQIGELQHDLPVAQTDEQLAHRRGDLGPRRLQAGGKVADASGPDRQLLPALRVRQGSQERQRPIDKRGGGRRVRFQLHQTGQARELRVDRVGHGNRVAHAGQRPTRLIVHR